MLPPRRLTSHVVLYHATFSDPPESLRQGLHNVPPASVTDQLQWLADRFDIVPIDEWFRAPDRRGLASITFDDAYLSVFREALPALRSLGLPATVFVNGCTLEGQVFWRDKIRWLVNTGQADAFLASLRTGHPLRGVPATALYAASKRPGLNSRIVDEAVDAFLIAQGIEAPDVGQHCARDADDLPTDPLLTYGNHTYSHYVMSSLTPEEQDREIERNERLLDDLGVARSHVLSLPFGDLAAFDEHTLRIARRHGLVGALLSRDRLNFGRKLQTLHGVAVCERYMAPLDLPSFRSMVAKMVFLHPPARSARRLARRLLGSSAASQGGQSAG